MKKYDNRIVQNRKSPRNEADYIAAYKELNPSSKRSDGLDIAAVRTKSGENGHVLLDPKINRSKDDGYHRGKDFISDKDLKRHIDKK